MNKVKFRAPGAKSDGRNLLRRFAGRIGLDFVVAGIKFANRQLGELRKLSIIVSNNKFS